MNTHFLGRAGEYAVASQLLVREIPVSFPAVDTGIDLIAGDSIRIQVKSVHSRRNRRDGYAFTLGSRTPKHGHKQYWLTLKDWSKCADFLVLWGVEENRFWVVPTSALEDYPKVQTLLVGSTGHRRDIDHNRVRELYAQGLRQCEIAKRMGISPMTVSESIRDSRVTIPRLCAAIDKFEGAWDGIENSLALIQQVECFSEENELIESKEAK